MWYSKEGKHEECSERSGKLLSSRLEKAHKKLFSQLKRNLEP